MSSQYRTITCILLCLIILAATAGCTSGSPYRLCLSHYSYDISIDTNETIRNVTVYLPVPIKAGKPMMGPVPLDKTQFARQNFTIDLVQSPPGLNTSDAYPVPGSQPWFLKVSADRIDPNPSEVPEYSVELMNSTDSLSPDVFVNTLYPLGNESVILPKMDFSLPHHQEITSRSPEWIEYAPARTPQTTLVYADYSSSPTTLVQIRSHLLGFNIWMEPVTPNTVSTGIDGGGNEYQDSYMWTTTGESHGWQRAEGMYGSTNSVYPNFSHPRWQEVIAAAKREA
jgi:hypothetical protein